MISMSSLIAEDCVILLERALLGKSICAFGEDGFGQYGRNEHPSWFTICEIDVCVECDDEQSPVLISGQARIFLEGYDSAASGHIMTDRNFMIRLQELLRAEEIDPDSLIWPTTLEDQGDDFVSLHIDIGLLLQWA